MSLSTQEVPCPGCEGSGTVKTNRGSQPCPKCKGAKVMPHKSAGLHPDAEDAGKAPAGGVYGDGSDAGSSSPR